jgi:hypothetical protein
VGVTRQDLRVRPACSGVDAASLLSVLVSYGYLQHAEPSPATAGWGGAPRGELAGHGRLRICGMSSHLMTVRVNCTRTAVRALQNGVTESTLLRVMTR